MHPIVFGDAEALRLRRATGKASDFPVIQGERFDRIAFVLDLELMDENNFNQGQQPGAGKATYGT